MQTSDVHWLILDRIRSVRRLNGVHQSTLPQNWCMFHTAVESAGFRHSAGLISVVKFRFTVKVSPFYRKPTNEALLMQEPEPSRGSTWFPFFMDKAQNTTKARHATEFALREAVMRVVKQRKAHRNFLQAAAETEARLLEGQPNAIFMYGL